MSEENNPAPTEPGAAVPENQTTTPEDVFKAEKEKLLTEIHKYKNQVKDLSAKSQAEKEQILKEQNRWQELAEIKDKRLKELEERDEATKKAFISEKKYNAVREAALKSGIRPEAVADLEMVSLDKVQIETTSTGRVNVLGVESAIEQLKLSRPHWFGPGKTVVAGSTPTVSTESGGLVTPKDLAKLSMEAAKTGDYTAYEKAFKQFKQQK